MAKTFSNRSMKTIGDTAEAYPSLGNELIFKNLVIELADDVRRVIRNLSTTEGSVERPLVLAEKEPLFAACVSLMQAGLGLGHHAGRKGDGSTGPGLFLAENEGEYLRRTEAARAEFKQAFAAYPSTAEQLMRMIDGKARELHRWPTRGLTRRP